MATLLIRNCSATREGTYTAIRFINLSVFLNPVLDPLRIAVTIKLDTSASRPRSVITFPHQLEFPARTVTHPGIEYDREFASGITIQSEDLE